MSAASFALFPDAREGEEPFAVANRALRARNVGEAVIQSPYRPMSHISPVRGWVSVGHGMDPDEMISILTGIDWHHPAMLVYRTSEDDRWSHLMVGLATPDLVIGEGA